MKLPVLTAADGAAWEAALVTALDRGDHGVTVVRRCVDIVELLAVAAAGQGRAALISAGLRRLDADTVDRLVAAQVVPIGVVGRGDSTAEDRLRAAGIDHLVPDDAEVGVVASVILEAVRADPAGASAPRMFGDPATSMAIPPGVGALLPADLPDRRGSVVAVWGPTGAPGRTVVAATLADEIARLGTHALLVDADVYGGTVAVLLGLLDESPGLAAACRQAGATRLDAAALAALCWQLAPMLRVLTGIPIAQRWPEVRAAAIEPVLNAARDLAAFIVVDCGFGLETDEELSFDSLAPRRNGATLAVLDQADVILAVGAADPIGVQRLVRGLTDLRDAEVSAPVWVVVNKVRRGVVAGDPATELTAALERFAGRAPAALLPMDQEALDAALAAGRLLAQSRPSSPLRQAVAELAAALVGVPAAPSRRRWR
ncbi:MAG: chromosome partitioning protein [Actinomycetota bacterium]|nr:chromosome partitioning protein [Actinomycetota bacterium]